MATLYEELTEGPLSVELTPLISARNDSGIAEIVNKKNIPVYSTVSVNNFAIWAASTGLRATIQDHADTPNSPLRAIALTLLDLLQGNLDRALDFGNAANIAMLEAWVTAGTITASQRDGLLLLSKKLISRADQIGGASLSQISDALNAGGGQ